MARRVIQLATLPGYADHLRGNAPTVYALCDDGSIWGMDGQHQAWRSISTRSIREGREANSPQRAVAPKKPSPSRSMKKGKAK